MIQKSLYDHPCLDILCGLISYPLPLLNLLTSLLFLEHIKHIPTSGPLHTRFTLLGAPLQNHMVLSLASARSLLRCHFIRWAFLAALLKIANYPCYTPTLPVLLVYIFLLAPSSSYHFIYLFVYFLHHTKIHICQIISSVKLSILFLSAVFYAANFKNTFWHIVITINSNLNE